MRCAAAFAVIDSAVLAQARARPPRRRPATKKIPTHNYIAEPGPGLPAEAPRAKAGAPAGNFNALRHGFRCREMRRRQRALRLLVRVVRANTRLAKLVRSGIVSAAAAGPAPRDNLA